MSKVSPQLIVGRALAISLTVCGLASILTTVAPTRFGNVNWEFGTLGEVAATSALPLMGLSAMAAVALFERKRLLAGTTGVLMLTLGLLGFAGLAILATDVPFVLSVARGLHPVEATSTKVIVVKTVALLFLFSIGFLGTGISALRAVRRGR